MPTKIELAATIMLLRNHPTEGLQALLLRRNKALKFASGFWVFPGGKIEATELATTENDLEAAKMAAVREAKEEADIDVAMDDLYFFSHWTTPAMERRRYATWFFFAEATDENWQITVDGSEVQEHLWLSPQAAFEKLAAREITLMPPTYVSLQRIQHCQSIAEVKQELQRSQPTYTTPVIELKNKKMYCMYEGDAGYETGKSDTPGARHRLVGNMLKGEYEFVYADCEAIFPLNGRTA